MKRLFSVLVAVLLIGSVTIAYSHTIVADPFTTQGAANHTWPVYNNSGVALDEGDVVIWDIGSSTGDDDLYITTTTTSSTGLVAGVVTSGGIAIATNGSIIVYGLAQCDVDGPGVAAGGELCTSTTAGDGGACAIAGNSVYAIAGIVGTASQIECFVK